MTTHRLRVTGPFDLDLTLSCGQAFRWCRDDGHWSGVVGACEVLARLPSPGLLEVQWRGAPPSLAAIREYFRLDEDPRVHLEHAHALHLLPGFLPLLGLRLLRQDPWETLASFICSAAANIRKISTCVEALASAAGEPITGSSRRSFPSAERLARLSEDRLRSLGLGFRAPYLRETAKRVAKGVLPSWEALRSSSIDQARAHLVALPGVGPKIADCVLLFGLDRLDAYPLDRWIRRATRELSSEEDARDHQLAAWAARLGPSRGYLQQILFHMRRTGGPLPALSVPGEPVGAGVPGRSRKAARAR